ncbi:hypothetical protein PUN28_011093 [Cardiocondyla obscurior]|uniref:Uncharacterized protein n=1 Tax=Cardiocondyla obscurior TaxID=286306 RepID=A0AAW2FJ37_9HYME
MNFFLRYFSGNLFQKDPYLIRKIQRNVIRPTSKCRNYFFPVAPPSCLDIFVCIYIVQNVLVFSSIVVIIYSRIIKIDMVMQWCFSNFIFSKCFRACWRFFLERMLICNIILAPLE